MKFKRFRIEYELRANDLEASAINSGRPVKAIWEGYHSVVAADSVWQALVFLGAELAQNGKQAVFNGPAHLKIVSVLQVTGEGSQTSTWNTTNSFTITDSASGNALAGLNLPGSSE